jgi:hypothetical protein
VAGNPAWKLIVPNQSYSVQVSFDRQPTVTWNGYGEDFGGPKGLTFPFSNANIWQWLAQANNVKFYYQGALLCGYNLPASDAAVREMFACVQAFARTPPTTRDPLVVRSPAVDPFQG